ncbi:MAG: aspartate--tRNA(Asn) ligase [Spirochaetes bacterium]|nr:aspartate--tRNA(Asn) ligase [Spirochaetota bacterium]
MKKRILVQDLAEYIGKEVVIAGWVHSTRKQGSVSFMLVRDRTGIAQVIASGHDINKQDVRNEAVVEVTGEVIEDTRAKTGVEIRLSKMTVISRPVKKLPILVNKKASFQKLELETVLNNRVLSLRNPKRHLIFSLQSEILDCFGTYFRKHGFTEITTPKIIASGTEGGTQLFSVDYFDKLAYLAQSPQFYKQMLVGAGYERVFEIGHVYRAEIHNTSRHLNEYVSLDIEMGFIEDEHDVMDTEEDFIRYLVGRINTHAARILEEYKTTLDVPDRIPRITVKEACAILERDYKKKMKTYDLDPVGEKLICEWSKKQNGSDFVFLTDYPRSKRPVYTMPKKDDPDLTRSFDLLFRGLEITTGGQRIHEYDMLIEAFKKRSLDPGDFDYYIDTFAYGMPPHGGLAIGLERITCQILGLNNVREASIFPRDRSRISP